VIDDIESANVDETWCLGDLVGYGAQPDECVALARESCDVCLVGNHDLVVLGKLDIDAFSVNAAVAARWTQQNIGQEALDFMTGLEPRDTEHPVGLFHGSPRDPVWEYVLSTIQAEACMDSMDARVGAIGHSHVALCFQRPDDGPVRGAQTPAGTELDLSEGHWLVNPGGVGQPRDGDPRAAYLVLDLDAGRAEFRRVGYDVERTQAEIREHGLPASLAERLAVGA
jgi:diadenosine tetraphosphatase ApaH/serine/threonine PP2A family protein phosphatase